MGDPSIRELGLRVRSYREASGLSQEAVASVLGIPRSAVSLLESGKRDISALELRRLSDLLGVRASQLLADEAGEDAPAPVLSGSSVRFRAQIADPQRESQLEAWLAEVQEKVSQAERLLSVIAEDKEEDLLQPAAWRLPRDYAERLSGFHPLRQGEEAASLERSRLNIGDSPIDDLAALLGRQGILVWGRLSDDEPPLDGLSFFDSNGRPMVFHFSRRDKVARASYRWRFTIAHGLGHLLFDFSPQERQAVADLEISAPGGAVPEQRANAFAAALLMPRDGLRSELQRFGWRPGEPLDLYWLFHLQMVFRVSFASLGYRLLNLGWLRQTDWEAMSHLQPQVTAVLHGFDPYSAVQETSSSGKGWIMPTALTSLAFQAYQSGRVSLQVLGEFLDLDLTEARQLTRKLQLLPRTSSKEARADIEALRSLKQERP